MYRSNKRGVMGFDFPASLRKAMELSGCKSVYELSMITGVPQTSLERIIHGIGFPSWISACQIINSFTFPLEFWFNGGKLNG